MTAFRSSIFAGSVTHKRLTPRRHGFTYRVFALSLDVDEIDRLDGELRYFSRDRRNLVSFFDADVGDSGPERVGSKVRRLLRDAGLMPFGKSVTLVTYPRLLGYVFNPLSVYFCRDDGGHLGALIYEVTNTFGERKSYLVETSGESGGAVAQACMKELYVSPFTAAEGTYSFHVLPPDDHVVIGVAFREGRQPVLKTHFRGVRVPLSDAAIVRMLARHPLMTFKVIGAIHYEAARLWAKGVPIVQRHASPSYSFTIVRTQQQDVKHA